MKYHCNSCNYYTDHKAKYERHIESKKHIVAINNDLSPLEMALILLELKEPKEPDVDIDDIINHVFFLTMNEYV